MLRQAFSLEKADVPSLVPKFCGAEKCKRGHAFGPAVRLCYLIHFVESGKGTFAVGGKEYALGPGDAFVISPCVKTYYKADEEDPWSYVWVGFEATGPLPVSTGPILHCPKAAGVFGKIREALGRGEVTPLFLSACLWEFFSLLEQKEPTDAVTLARDLIDAEYMTDCSISSLAARVGMDRSWLTAKFKERYGTSPGRYRMDLRLSLAASLMAVHGQSVKTAAYSVGYLDLYHFSRVFKEKYGVSPRAWRNKNACKAGENVIG